MAPPFLMSVLNAEEWSTASAAITQAKSPRYGFARALGDPRGRSGPCGESGSQYADCGMPVRRRTRGAGELWTGRHIRATLCAALDPRELSQLHEQISSPSAVAEPAMHCCQFLSLLYALGSRIAQSLQ
jgi:hypothetical protein